MGKAQARSARVAIARSQPEIKATCNKCGIHFRDHPTLTFLGFQKLKCPNCSYATLLPLKPGYRITYWAILALMILAAINALSKGGVPVPGLLGIAVIIGIVKDIRLRRKLTAADARKTESSEG